MKQIPLSDLTPLEQAVWAAEYVRARSQPISPRTDDRGQLYILATDGIDGGIRSANDRVAELRETRVHP